MSFEADFERNIEEYALHIVAIILGQFDPAVAVVRGKVGGIDVIHGAAGDEAGLEHGAQIGKDEILEALLLGIIEKKFAQEIARERMNVVPLEPRTLAGAGESDGENHGALAGPGLNRSRLKRRGLHRRGLSRCGVG